MGAGASEPLQKLVQMKPTSVFADFNIAILRLARFFLDPKITITQGIYRRNPCRSNNP